MDFTPESPEESIQTPLLKDIFVCCVEKSLLSLVDYLYAILVTGNSLTSSIKPNICFFLFFLAFGI